MMIVPIANKIRIKTPEQIEGIRKSCQLAARCLEFIRPFIVPGVTSVDLNKKIADFILQNGATSATLNYPSYKPGNRPFPAETCVSLNEGVCHGVPGLTVLKDGDVVKIDVATILNGYFGDTCSTFLVGKTTKKARKLIEVTEDCLRLGVNQVKPNGRFGDIGYVISQYAQKNGFGVVREFCGHGVGVEFHEEPQVIHISPKGTGSFMRPGMIFTIEPMITMGKPDIKVDEKDGWSVTTLDGQVAAQFEHTVLVTNNGVEILTLP
jgi:methionyl aminopeptidase